MNTNDTIVAAATPYGRGGIAVVRMSGKMSMEIVEKISILNSPLEDRRPTNTDLIDGEKNKFDSSLITYFKNPSSYTGDDVIEISCHGSPAIVNTIIELCCKHGARIADPGEFTRRAFLNGKIDLIQAEAVAGLINSNSTACADLNQRILSGELSGRFGKIKNDIVEGLSFSEFELDISEGELTLGSGKHVLKKLSSAHRELVSLLSSYQEGRMINKGATVAITGKPNVGKSTLYNALLNENRAIVNESPGTTRDTLEAFFTLGGVAINLVDTAGIREGLDEVEKEGIERAQKTVAAADIVLHVVDSDTDSKTNHKNSLFVRNKIDLALNTTPDKNNGRISVSAKTGAGVDNLKKKIIKTIGLAGSSSHNIYITTQRQRVAVEEAVRCLKNAIDLLSNKTLELELVSLEAREALSSIDGLLGKTTSEDILNTVFSGFCVGK